MTLRKKNSVLVKDVIEISRLAGSAILEEYGRSSDVMMKEDKSPLTQADIQSNKIIVNKLEKLTPSVPILSEEQSDVPFETRSSWSEYWLIDPLDGTKEFLKKNGEFTVNIALIENNTPTLGVIYVPVSGETFWGSEENGSFYSSKNKKIKKINVSNYSNGPIRIVTSRSHINPDLLNILNEMDSYELVSKGSSLKFCLIASGEADIYPRFGKTSEWDTAAGEAIVRFAGGYIITIDNKEIKYNTEESLLNPYFIVSSSKGISQKFLDSIKKKISNKL